MMDIMEQIEAEHVRMEAELDIHRAIIAKYDVIMDKWKKINNFLLAGTIISIVMIVVTAVSGNESLNFASNIMALISIVAMSTHLIVMAYCTYKSGQQYDLMQKVIRRSIERNIKWSSQTESATSHNDLD